MRIGRHVRLPVSVLLIALTATCSGSSDHASAVRTSRPALQPEAKARTIPKGALQGRIPVEARVVVVPSKASFRVRVVTIDAGIRERMGTSWRPGCPVPLEELRIIEMTFWNFEGGVQTGELMVHRRYADQVTGVFRELFDARFPIERMELANGYMGNDPPLAQRNNTAGFNCRRSVGSRAWSEHAYGRAVDINPDQNPYVSPSGRIEPPFGSRWVDRSLADPGMIRPGDVVVQAFRSIGWRWGGAYRRSKDWMHFSVTGR